MHAQLLQLCPTLCDPMDCSRQAPPSVGFSRQEYWSGLPYPPPRDLPNTGTEPESPGSLSHWGSPFTLCTLIYNFYHNSIEKENQTSVWKGDKEGTSIIHLVPSLESGAFHSFPHVSFKMTI